MLRKDKKAFTLTEVIATLAILGIILLIAIPGVGKLQENFRKNYYEQLDGSVLAAAKTYYKDNAEERPVNLLEASFLDYNKLRGSKYIDTINKYNADDASGACDGKIVVVKTKDDYIYKNCMDCGEYKNYKAPDKVDGQEDNICLFSDNDKIINGYTNITDGLILHVGNYTNKYITDKFCLEKTVSRFSEGDLNKLLYQVDSGDKDQKCPTNISSINYRTVNNEKDYTLKYDGKDLVGKDTAQITIFQHDMPIIQPEEENKVIIEGGRML